MSILIPHGDFIASFYVSLTADIFGGEIIEHDHINSRGVSADIVNWKTNQVYEVKGSHRSDRHMLRHPQIDLYNQVSLSAFPLDRPEAYYFLWEHDISPIMGKSTEELEILLRESSERLLVLSFDIIQKEKEILSPSTPKNWEPYTSLRASERKEFHRNPDIAIEKLGLDPSRYYLIQEPLGESFKSRIPPNSLVTMIYPIDWNGLEIKC